MSRKRHAPKAIEKAVATAANRAEWLEPSDAAAVRLAKRLGETLDELYESAGASLLPEVLEERAGKTTYTAQTLLRVLNDLGLTATSRDALGYGSRRDTDDALEGIRSAIADVVPIVK